MIIFKAFQGIENFYIKFQYFPYFSSICTNRDYSTTIFLMVSMCDISLNLYFNDSISGDEIGTFNC